MGSAFRGVMTNFMTPVALDVSSVRPIVRCHLGLGELAVCGGLGRWAPAIEDIVPVSETVLTATTVWSGHGSDRL